MRFTILLALGLLAGGHAMAVNRCVDGKGKVTYQDSSCPGAEQARAVDTTDTLTTKSKSAGWAGPTAAPVDPAYATAKGAWRGPAQFQSSTGGVRDQDAQRVTPMVIELKPSGEVVGVITEAGCRLSGLSTQSFTPNVANVDVTVKGCHDGRFNVRFSGMLAVYLSAKEAKLSLNAIGGMARNGKINAASIDAVLKR